jgi:hypothetical protein
MYYYYAYGLKVKSDIRLPFLGGGLKWHRDTPFSSFDVRVQFNANTKVVVHLKNGQRASWSISREYAELAIIGMGRFHVSHGKNIYIHTVRDCDKQILQLIITTSLLAISLYQRKTLALHASAIQIGSKTAAFLGDSGAGKSLIAGGLVARGYPMLTDDLAALTFYSSRPYIQPGFPIIKMAPKEYTKLGFNGRRNIHLPANRDKVGCVFSDHFVTEPKQLGCIFVLNIGNERKIRKLSLKDSFMQLISNSPPAIWDVLPDEIHFEHIAKLAHSVPVYVMTREKNIKAIPEHAKMIEEFMLQNEYQNVPVS